MTLTYQYSRSAAWIDNLVKERDPHAYDLCERHGQRLTVPSGWRLEDRRSRYQMTLLDSTQLNATGLDARTTPLPSHSILPNRLAG